VLKPKYIVIAASDEEAQHWFSLAKLFDSDLAAFMLDFCLVTNERDLQRISGNNLSDYEVIFVSWPTDYSPGHYVNNLVHAGWKGYAQCS
jgi:hypothetical protein